MKKILLAFILSCSFLPIFSAVAKTDEIKYLTDVDITNNLILEGDATFDEDEQAILLCPNKTWSNGKAKYPFEVLENFNLKFDFKIGGGTSADGIVIAFYAEKDSVTKEGEYLNFEGCGGYGLELDTYRNTNDSNNAHVAIIHDKVSNHLISVDDERVNDNEWHSLELTTNDNNLIISIDDDEIIDTEIEFDKTFRYMYFAASTGASRDNHYIKNVKFTGRAAYANASDWAIEEMDKAEEYNLIPEILKGSDMTKPINRLEFASLSVNLYESITNENIISGYEPFVDTDNTEVGKAYSLGITNGISETEFAPSSNISREQVATMLTRTLVASSPDLDVSSSGVTPFSDDWAISSWAKDSVYYMYSKNIINGMGDNKFAPKNTTTSEEATMYANSTREQAILIAVRAYESLK